MKNKKCVWYHGWYHDSEFERTHQIKFLDVYEDPVSNWHGPFDSFGESKNDAIEYHETDIHTARCAIGEIKEMKKPKKGKT